MDYHDPLQQASISKCWLNWIKKAPNLTQRTHVPHSFCSFNWPKKASSVKPMCLAQKCNFNCKNPGRKAWGFIFIFFLQKPPLFLHLNALISRVGRVLQIFSRISLVYSPHRFCKCYSDSLFMIRTAGGGFLKKKHLFIKVIIFGTSGTQRSTPLCGVHQECKLDHQKKSFRWCCFYPNFMFSK